MFRILFLILALMSSVAFSQVPEKPEALIVDEFGRLANGDIKARLDYFILELQNNPTSRGLIISYGSKREIAAREKMMKTHISFRQVNNLKEISFINGGHGNEIKTQLWRVPESAENPKPEPTAFILDEFGTVTNANLKGKIENFYKELYKNTNAQGYIINYGPNREVTRRERLIRDFMTVRSSDGSVRIVFVNGGNTGKLKTVIWLVPQGVEPPKP